MSGEFVAVLKDLVKTCDASGCDSVAVIDCTGGYLCKIHARKMERELAEALIEVG